MMVKAITWELVTLLPRPWQKLQIVGDTNVLWGTLNPIRFIDDNLFCHPREIYRTGLKYSFLFLLFHFSSTVFTFQTILIFIQDARHLAAPCINNDVWISLKEFYLYFLNTLAINFSKQNEKSFQLVFYSKKESCRTAQKNRSSTIWIDTDLYYSILFSQDS